MGTKIFLLGIILSQAAYGQNFTEKISKELVFERPSTENALVISNISGSVKVVGYNGDKILLEATKTINAKTEERLENGKLEIQIGIIDRADTLIVYVQDGCNQFRKSERGNRSGWHLDGWSYQTFPNGCHLVYDYTMDFTVRVPASLNLLVSTINEGDVIVENVDGVVKAGNINGSIRLSDLKRESDASTINGDVDIGFAANPKKECRFYSLNGDINALFQPGLSAQLSFESFNGSFYTNITNIENLPVEVQKISRGDGLKFKVTGNRYRIGQGDAFLDFETFNGNVYLKEKTN